ncbi:putative phage protein gp47/JayE [Paraburkholderia youngii]|uniref:baseplate J/gp47 family protein n=1 Tax=Paraburkholderia youngii TaxID=2782701 RepID=UPI003D2570DE
MTITSVAPVINATGISAPVYSDILGYLISKYQAIYGSDIYLGNDSQDYQFLAVLARAMSDCNSACVAVYNSFLPAGAQGTGLSSLVKLNGLTRNVPTFSTAQLTIVGQANQTINNGLASDGTYQWALPSTVTIPAGGQITVTSTCTTLGAINAATGAINQIATPTFGWQSVTNASQAIPGAPVETDSALRIRQAASTMLPSQTVLAGIVGAVQQLTGVTACIGYDNDTNATNSLGIPPHSIALIVEGGTPSQIAQTIALKKTQGTGTYGTTSIQVADTNGLPITISFSAPSVVSIVVTINLTMLPGYSANVTSEIQNAVANYINALNPGQSVSWSKLFLPANLNGSTDSATYDITSLQLAANAGPLGTSDIVIAYNQLATCLPSNVTVVTH